MSSIRPTGTPPAMISPSGTNTDNATLEAARTMVLMSNSAPKTAEPAPTSPLGALRDPGSLGTAAIRHFSPGERSAKKKMLEGAGMPNVPSLRHEEVQRLSSSGAPHGAVSADPSTSSPGKLPGRHRMLSMEEMLLPPETRSPIDPPRASSPRGALMAASLRQSYRATRSPFPQPPDTTVQAVPLDKGKGKAIEKSLSPERETSPSVLGDKRQRSPSQSPGATMPPAKRTHINSPLANVPGPSFHEATAASQSHPYINITPRQNVAQMLEQGKSLVDIWEILGESLTPPRRSALSQFANRMQEKGKTAAEVFSNFHAFSIWSSDFFNDKTIPVSEKGIIRNLRSRIFVLPSQAKVDELIQMAGTEFANDKEFAHKTYKDSAGRLDDLVATMMFNGSLYDEGPDAARRFINVKHDITSKIKKKEISVQTNFNRFLTMLRQAVHPLPLDNVLRDIVAGCLQNVSASVKEKKEPSIKATAGVLAEIAFMKGISPYELIRAIEGWKKARIAILSPHRRRDSGAGSMTEGAAAAYKAAQTPRQIKVFQMINETLNGVDNPIIADDAINYLSGYLNSPAGQAYGEASTSGHAS